MKKFHRALALFSASLVMSLHIVPAHAVETDEPLTDAELYELEYEKLLIEGLDDEAVLWSLDDRTSDRTFSYDGRIVFTGSNWSGFPDINNGTDSYFEPNNNIEVDWQGSGGYLIGSGIHRINVTYYQLFVGSGTYIDYTAPSTYAYQDGGKLTFSGSVQMRLAETWYNSSSFVSIDVVPDYGGVYAYPDRMALMVNGDVVTSVVSVGNGTFHLNYDYELSEPVYSVGYRFYYDSQQLVQASSNVSNIKSLGLYLWLDDNAFVSEFVPEQYVPLFKEVITEVKQIPATVYNFFFGEDGDEVAEGFKSEVDGVIGSGEVVREEFEALQKPDPTDTIPDIYVIIPQEEFQAYTAVFADVLQSKLVLPLMVMALSMALMAYVVYGKKG